MICSQACLRLGLFGWPIDHSLSPDIHNKAFQKAGLDWVYELWPTKPEDLEEAILNFRAQKFLGANITVPYKEAIIGYLDALTPRAKAIGAVNTLFWDQDKLTGDNTDAAGFLEDLCQKGVELKNKSALILGSGGSAKAIKYALEQAGALVETWTRKSALELAPKDITINCTPGLDAGLLEQINFKPGQVLYDLVYMPEITPIMRRALDTGALAFNGKGMLIKQAALSFEVWELAL